MPSASYSFLDVAVLDPVRQRFAAGDALVILSADLRTILWVNGPGAALLGRAHVDAAIGSEADLPAIARRQIAATPAYPDIGSDRAMLVRLTPAVSGTTTALLASSMIMPDGEKALLLVAPVIAEEKGAADPRALGGFDEDIQFLAFIDGTGKVEASSTGFAELAIAPATLAALVEDVARERGRMIKRRVKAGTRTYPAGMARLSESPLRHLLVVVDDGGAQEQAAPDTAASDSNIDGSRHDHWYFDHDTQPKAAAPQADLHEGQAGPGAQAQPVRFVWRTDAQGRFSSLSGEFAAAVGAPAADVVGRRFRDVAAAFGFDPAGEVAALLERRDTWSGRSVMWPLSGTDLSVPVDLAALPAYSRERDFEGFRGFGVVRMAEARPDPEKIGLALVPNPPQPAEHAPRQDEEPSADKVIRLAERRAPPAQEAPASDRTLSASERNAFREIAERLRKDSMAEADFRDARLDGDGLEPAMPEIEGAPRPAGPAPSGPDTAILARLPVPLLIHAGDVLHYANAEFLDLAGYDTLAAVEEAGGLDALFADPYAPAQDDAADADGTDETMRHALLLRQPGGKTRRVEAILRSVPWQDGTALMLVLRPAGEEPGHAAAAMPAAHAADRGEIAELKARIGEMRAIIDTATDGVVLIGRDGAIRSISRPAEALFGFDSADVAGKPFISLFAVESQQAARDYLAGLTEPGVASVLNDGRQLIGREAQGRFIPLFMTIGALPGDSGFCAVVRDVTQWKRAEEDLTKARALAERASSQKSEFLARISHEIRTPLNAIIGFSELMMDERFGPVANDRYRDYLRDINRSGNHVLDLVNDLLDISKIEAGQQEMDYKAVSLNDALAETVALMQPQANRERVIIRSSFASRLPDVVADPRSMRQIALNILSNAIRYTQAGGQVIVSTAYEASGDVVMRVRDTGIGMTQAEIEQALKPFRQVNELKRARGDGTGLGLPLTKAMVEANRARFTITSTPGEGTLVEVAFPSVRVLAG